MVVDWGYGILWLSSQKLFSIMLYFCDKSMKALCIMFKDGYITKEDLDATTIKISYSLHSVAKL
jgi:hypothetical protein